MTATDDKPGVDERYAQAIESSHLEVLPTRCPVDYLIAAGWCKDGLGAKLYRLRTEFDTVRSEHRQAEAQARASADEARQLVKRAARLGGFESNRDESARLLAASYSVTEGADRAALTARVLMLAHLQTLNDTKEALFGFAVTWATRRRFMWDDGKVGRIAGRALDVWLDPNCPHCEGRSFNGGFTEPRRLCVECDATGKRTRGRAAARLHEVERGHQFGLSLLTEMDRKADRVTGAMRLFLQQHARDDATWGEAEAAALRAELFALRSAQAQED